jgi:hypothetical protein
VAGHTHGTDSRAKHVVGKSLGSPDARKIYFAVMRSLPSKAPTVRGLVALHAQHMAQHAALTTAAEAAGIATPEGQKLMALADEQGRRAERTLVTAHDLARIAAESEAKARPPAWQQWAPPTTEDDEADDQQPESKETDDDE